MGEDQRECMTTLKVYMVKARYELIGCIVIDTTLARLSVNPSDTHRTSDTTPLSQSLFQIDRDEWKTQINDRCIVQVVGRDCNSF